MVTRSSARLHGLRSSRFQRCSLISNIVSEGFDECEVIPDRQCPTKLKRVFCWDYEIFGLLDICFITRWPVYHIKMATHFSAAVWLELGLE